MPDEPKDTQGQPAGGGPGLAGPPDAGVAPEAQGLGGGDAAAPQGGTPAGGEDWKAKFEAEAERRSSMQTDFDRLRKLERDVGDRFGPQDEWTTPPDEDTQAAPEPTPQAAAPVGTPAAQAYDPYGPQSLAQWAQESFDGAGSPSGQIAFVRRFDSFLREQGVTPPWDGTLMSQPQQQAPQQPMGDFLTKEEAVKLWNTRESVAETIEDGLETIETTFGKDFLNQKVKDANGRDTTLVRALRTRCYQGEGVTPEAVLKHDFEGYWEKAKEAQITAAVMAQLQQDQATMGEPSGRGSMAPIPEPAPNAQMNDALLRAGEGQDDVALDRPEWQSPMITEQRHQT